MEKENVDFPNAVRLLADRYHVRIPENTGEYGGSGGDSKAAEAKDRLYLLHEKIQAWYENNLWSNPACSAVKDYLEGRQIPREVAKKFGLGAAPDSWDAAITWSKREKFTEEELLSAGLIKTSENASRNYDHFRNRLIFPIWNEQGKVVAFSARTIVKDTKEAKYVNSPETPIFKKSRILYALPLSRQAIGKEDGFAILCEGQLDAIAMHRAGCENAVAPQGTAFTEEQAVILKRYTRGVRLAFDADGAGQQAIMKAIKILLPMEFDIKVIRFPGGKDPDELYKNSGAEAIKDAVGAAIDFFDFLFQKISAEHDVSTPQGKGALSAAVIEYINLIPNAVARTAYASKLSGLLGLPEQAIYDELNKSRNKVAAQKQIPDSRGLPPRRRKKLRLPQRKKLRTPPKKRWKFCWSFL